MDDFRPIISIKEARKVLGSKSKVLTDGQMDDIIQKLYLIAKGTVEQKSSI